MSRNQTSNATTTNVSTLPAAAKAQTAKEVIAENVKLLIAQLGSGHSEGLTRLPDSDGQISQLQLRQHP